MRRLVLLLSTVFLAACAKADAATTLGHLTLTTRATSPDSCAYRVAWALVPANSGGAPDHYLVIASAGGTRVRQDTVVGPPDSFAVARPALPDSTIVTASVAAMRRGVVYASASASAVCHGIDVALPAPDSVKVDSATLQVLLRILPESLTLAVGDSALVHAVGVNPYGDTIPAVLPVTWATADSAYVALHPVTGTRDAWVVGKALTDSLVTGMDPRLQPYAPAVRQLLHLRLNAGT